MQNSDLGNVDLISSRILKRIWSYSYGNLHYTNIKHYYYYYYFQSLYNNYLFEVKWVHFNAVPNSNVLPQDFAHKTVNFNLSCFVAIYSLCYSIMKSRSCWNSNTLATIVDNSKRVCDNLCLNECISLSNLPKNVDICGAEVSFHVLSNIKEALLCDSVKANKFLKML